jgi:hypothetical protein
MSSLKSSCIRAALASIVGLGALLAGDVSSITSGVFVTTASARIGRPLTPLSYAGVARRTTRRAVGYGAAVGAAAVGYGAAAGRCVQVADAYGRIITRCY